MERLIHWEYATAFSAHEAAYLILGTDPASGTAENDQLVRPILDRMADAYNEALTDYYFDWERGFVHATEALRERDRAGLESEEMARLVQLCRERNDATQFMRWFKSENSEFHRQTFSRAEIQRWIAENQLPAKYQFSGPSVVPSESDKPLITRERNTLLSIIAVLCKEARLDYKSPAKTAGLIQHAADQLGFNIGETTIEGHLKKIPAALAGRTK